MRKWVIAVLLLILFTLSVFSGFLVNSFINFSKKKENSNDAILADDKIKNTVDTNYTEITVSPNAELVLTEKFEKCGHTITKREPVPRDIVNLNEDKVREYYKDWNVDYFSSEKIQISRNNIGICNEHYILRESDGYISISSKNDIGEYIFKGLTDISVQYLPEDDLKKLEVGIEVVGRDNLNKFLEDYE